MQEQKKRKPDLVAPTASPILPIENVPCSDILGKIDSILTPKPPEKTFTFGHSCECRGCAGVHDDSLGVRLVNGRWFCDGCATEREKGRKQ